MTISSKKQPDEIAWHTRAILQHGDNPAPLVLMRAHRKYAAGCGTDLYLYAGSTQPVCHHRGYSGSYESGCTRCTDYYSD